MNSFSSLSLSLSFFKDVWEIQLEAKVPAHLIENLYIL